jgi:tetratricopeptide (TPR) repeat protein
LVVDNKNLGGQKSSKPTDAAVPQTFEEVVAGSLGKLEAALKTLPPEKIAQAKKDVDKMFQGDLSWADLSQYTPERLMKLAEMGYSQFELGQFDSSERIFKGLTIIDPDNPYCHQMLGATYQKKEMPAESIVEYSVAIALSPNDIVSYTNRGEVYFKLGIHELAAADFDQAIKIDTKGNDRWANRARMLKEQIKLIKQRKK